MKRVHILQINLIRRWATMPLKCFCFRSAFGVLIYFSYFCSLLVAAINLHWCYLPTVQPHMNVQRLSLTPLTAQWSLRYEKPNPFIMYSMWRRMFRLPDCNDCLVPLQSELLHFSAFFVYECNYHEIIINLRFLLFTAWLFCCVYLIVGLICQKNRNLWL